VPSDVPLQLAVLKRLGMKNSLPVSAAGNAYVLQQLMNYTGFVLYGRWRIVL
jgi:hypothetical protein